MKNVDFEYGQGVMTAELPDSADIFVPGETVPDPPHLEDPVAATRESILNPIGMDPISKLVRKKREAFRRQATASSPYP